MNGDTYSISAVRFAVYGEGRWEPAPQGSKTPNRNGGVRESSKYLKPWRKKVIEAAAKVLEDQCEGIPFDGPLAVDLVFRMHRGKTVRRTHHTTTPDGDKLMRAVFDGLTQGGLITDDSIVIKGTYEKGYATPKSGQGVLITIHKVIT